MISIIPYEERYAEAVKDLLVQLQTYLVQIDPLGIQALPEEYRERYFQLTMEALAAHQGKLLLAVEKERMIGLVAGIIEAKDEVDRLTNRCPKRGKVTELVVEQSMRGAGIGQKLLREMETFLSAQGCEQIAIDVFAPNQTALRFYGGNGYAPRNIEMMKPLPNQNEGERNI